jgi:hypothetical protein
LAEVSELRVMRNHSCIRIGVTNWLGITFIEFSI